MPNRLLLGRTTVDEALGLNEFDTRPSGRTFAHSVLIVPGPSEEGPGAYSDRHHRAPSRPASPDAFMTWPYAPTSSSTLQESTLTEYVTSI